MQQLTPVIKAVSEDVDDLSAYLSVDLHSKKKAEKTVTETSRRYQIHLILLSAKNSRCDMACFSDSRSVFLW